MMPDDDWMLAQGTVDFRNEERRARNDNVDRYRDEVGHEPPEDPDHPLAKQWEYRGTRAEKNRLRYELGEDVEDDDEPRGEQPTQEESLF